MEDDLLRLENLGELLSHVAASPHVIQPGALSVVAEMLRDAHASEQDRPGILTRREALFESQLDLDPERLVLVDEAWASTNMARRYGRAPQGQRLRASVPHGHVWTLPPGSEKLRTGCSA